MISDLFLGQFSPIFIPLKMSFLLSWLTSLENTIYIPPQDKNTIALFLNPLRASVTHYLFLRDKEKMDPFYK